MAAVKFDKEMLLKHRFWIMLGVAVTLTLVGILILEFSEVEGRVPLKKVFTDGKTTKAPDGPKSIEDAKANAELAKKNEAIVWKNAYQPQADLATWPQPVEEKYDFANGYFANDVKILKLPDAAKGSKDAAKAWPADNPFLMHGAFIDGQEDSFKIKDRAGEVHTFFPTKRTENIAGEDGKPVPFHSLRTLAKGKLLAVSYQRGKYFNDQLTPKEQKLFKDSYIDQIAPLLKSVDPLDTKMNGVVQFRGYLYDKDNLPQNARFVRYVSAKWPEGNENISTQAWIAQEDLWIQREIFRMIRSANDSVSNFTPKTEGKKEERNKPYAFQNSYFDLELKLDKDETLFFKITNRLARKQSIDLSFRVLLNGTKGHEEEIIKISGDALMPAGTKGQDFYAKSFPKQKDDRTGIYSVQQVLNWQTAAIKRIDQISIGSNEAGDVSHSQRTLVLGLRPFDDKAAVDFKAGKGAAGGKGMGKKAPNNVPPPGGDKGKKNPGGGGGQGAGNVGLDPFGLGVWTDRYSEVTEQARRLPVAVVLIVDQEHVDRVLNSFNNSKLRFLETQVLLNQYSGSLQPQLPADEDANPNGGAGRRPRHAEVRRPRRFAPGGGIPQPGIGIGASKGNEPAGSADLETNMEMVIYGIVTLYQRYPPRPPMAAAPAAAPPPTRQRRSDHCKPASRAA